MATQPATRSAASAEMLARRTRPSSAAAPEYSASSSATPNANNERKNARTPGRSALDQRFATVEVTLTGRGSQRNRDGLDDFAQYSFGGFGFLLQRGVPRTGDHAMRKNRHSELLKVVR